jgi:hypothetical protein
MSFHISNGTNADGANESIITLYLYHAECLFSECHYAFCHYTECHNDDIMLTCHCAVYRYDEFHCVDK